MTSLSGGDEYFYSKFEFSKSPPLLDNLDNKVPRGRLGGLESSLKFARVPWARKNASDLTLDRISIKNADLRELNHVCGNKDGWEAVSGITGGYP